MIDIYLDCADLNQMRQFSKNKLVRGFTTNPSLMKAAWVIDYEVFAKEALEIVDDLPISFEVISDELDEMERQARKIASWGKNVYVKIPVTNTKGESSIPLIEELSSSDIVCNVTAVLSVTQIYPLLKLGAHTSKMLISVFSGRVADTSIDPRVHLAEIISTKGKNTKILWASSREILNIKQANDIGCDIITVSPDLLKKYELLKDKDLAQYSLETVQQFYNDAKKAGYKI